ncbi:Asp23/Gls24 family envelope stress response protein [Actinomadura sp. SCN-SB]|uniref:Asp23/Gls24 family envelope stress response protein n=1 Tax=Actinomadura sp. SCN-SB TaxID=3373092 RepID=UPI003753D9A9
MTTGHAARGRSEAPMAEPPPAPEPSPDRDDPYHGERGHTTIADRAVERIVARAMSEDGGGLKRTARPIRGRMGGPRVDVDVHGSLVTARVQMAVVYPDPVREVARRVRERVRDRVRDLTGLTVRHLDIEVARLEPLEER